MFGCGILKWAYVDDVDDVDPELSNRVRGLISVILPQCKWMRVSWWLSVVKFKWMEIPARAMWQYGQEEYKENRPRHTFQIRDV